MLLEYPFRCMMVEVKDCPGRCVRRMSRKKGERLIAENRLFRDLPENARHIVEAYIVAAKKQSVLTRGWVFGSYAWGEPRKGSDIDLYLVVERRP